MSGFGAELGRGNVHGRTTVLALVSMHRTNEAAAHLSNEPEGLAQVLSGLEVTEAESVRLRLERGAHHTATDGMTLIVVLEGTVRFSQRAVATACVTRPSITHRADEILSAGDALLTCGDDVLHLESLDDAHVVVSHLRLAETSLRHAAALPSMLAVVGFRERGPAAGELAQHLGEPSGVARPGNPVICLLMHRMLLLEVIRVWFELGCAPRGWPTADRDPHLDRVVAAVDADPGRAWTVDTLARVGAMSRSAFAAAFREHYGVSPARFVTQTRMALAMRMLGAGASVAEVGAGLGYASTEGFSRRFREHIGVTPSTWVAMQRGTIAAPLGR
ncbi:MULTISPECIES: helix-turn-helix transcriptional regulator [unclassified Microbacterium]|uniref:helix-turn-helix transcriptional regulator n=1 Tax=unclassified Microbacterium TaxID=2609290 RepID=UPI000C2C3D0B|nr:MULTISPECIES: AraC family transcriptional regulator [unclassified Microbacterium]